MTQHPYKSLPDKAFWRRSVAGLEMGQVDPVGEFGIALTPKTRVATAGSCFAQHIARHLSQSGFNYYIAEAGHPLLSEKIRDAHNYKLYSARYGNIYTARQLLQLFRRAYGTFKPAEAAWKTEDGSIVDPFRPTIQPGGFVSETEMLADRRQHFAAVRRMFETLDVLVFTLGLTECWASREDGAVFPLCPGVEGGVFDPDRYAFYNQTVTDVMADMSAFVEALQFVNPQARMILTVSPVPLMATAQTEAHVLSATVYSKSVLRVAADMLSRTYENVHYFPSYEIVSSPFNRGRYFAPDLRNVTEEGVEHVMRVFLSHATTIKVDAPPPISPNDGFDAFAAAEAVMEVECDEVALDR